MKTELLYDRLSDKWVPAAVDAHLIDRPLNSILGDGLLGALENNMLETADKYKLEIAVPGMKKKNLKLEVANGVLTVQGQKQQKDVLDWFGKSTQYKSTQIYRTFVLPEDADEDGIRAKCRDGLLKISIPKVKSHRSHRSIPLKSADESESWLQKLAKPFKKLNRKLSNMMKRFGANSAQNRVSWL